MSVSCLCLTYGRPALLEESIESFLRQQWTKPKELIVVNDHPDQELIIDARDVIVINLKRRIRTLGEKRNFAASVAQYEHLLVWDDDDLYLPWRIDVTMRNLPTQQFFKCPWAWVMNRGQLKLPQFNLFHASCAYTRTLFAKIGGYSCINGGEDLDFENAVKAESRWADSVLPTDLLYYIYRWGHGHYHTTGVNDLADIKPNVDKGTVTLHPHWKEDYVAMTARLMNKS